MNTRICSVVAAATLLSLSSGCCGMKNFLFGRGARCGLCNKLSSIPRPQFGNVMQAPCGQTPYTPAAPAPQQYAAPAYQPQSTCGCNNNTYGAPAYSAGETCGTCYSAAHSGIDCGCNSGVNSYAPAMTDPYGGGQVIHDGGAIYGGEVYGGQVVPNSPTIMGDSFNARKVDADGNKILWEEPLPPGTKPL